MKIYTYTIDNYLRNPFRWGYCPINIDSIKIYGIYFHYGEIMPTNIKKRWLLVIFFHKWYKSWSNYPLS